MAAPNIVNVTSITGKTDVVNPTTGGNSIVSNSAASNKVYKINYITVANVDGGSSADITINFNRSSTDYPILYTVTVDNDATLDVLNKPIYLEEGDSLNATASADGDLTIVCSYEIIE
jgi:hypothetical protein